MTAALLLLLAAPQDNLAGVSIRAWRSELEGRASSDGSLLPASDVDFASDLGLDGAETEPEIRAFIQVPVFGRLHAGWWSLRREGDEVLEQSIAFDDHVFTASTRVESQIDLDVYTFGYEFVLPSIPVPGLGKLEVGLGLAAKAIHIEASISDAGQEASDSVWFGLPVLGARVSMELTEWVRAEGEVAALTFSASDREATYAEASFELVLRPLPWVFAGIGYKYVTIDLDDESGDTGFELEVDVKGFYLTAGVRF